MINSGVHVTTQGLCCILHQADADTVDAQSNEGTVVLQNDQNVRELDVIGLGFSTNSGTLLSQSVVQEADYKTYNCARNTCDGVTGAVAVTKLCHDHRTQQAGDHVTDHGANATSRRQRSTLGVIGRHSGQQRTHGDIEHGVGCFIQDLAREQNYNQSNAIYKGRHSPQCDRSYTQQRCGAQQPGTELAVLVLLLCESLVHQCTHHRVIDCVPNSPNNDKGAQQGGVDTQSVGAVHGEHSAHQSKGHASAPVAKHVAKPVLLGQAGLRCVGHKYFLQILFCERTPIRSLYLSFMLQKYERKVNWYFCN